MRRVPEVSHLDGYAPLLMWAAIGFFLLFLAITLPALLGDWWRRRRSEPGPRCPRCWYSMKGVDGLRCPECGRTAASPSHLLKNRRRWGWVAVALLPLTLSCAGLFTLLRGIDPVVAAFVPDRVIVTHAHACGWYMPTTPWQRFCTDTLEKRYNGSWPAHVRTLALALEKVTVVPSKVESRPIWPSGSHIRILVGGKTVGSTLRSLSGTRVIASFDTATLEKLPPSVVDNLDVTDPILIDLGTLPDGSYTLGINLTLVDASHQSLLISPVKLPITVGGDVASVLKPLDDRGTQVFWTACLQNGIRFDRELGLIELGASTPNNQTTPPPLSVRIELDGVVIARGKDPLTVPITKPGVRYFELMTTASIALTGDPAALASPDLNERTCVLILEPDIEAMLADPKRSDYPNVSFRLPVAKLAAPNPSSRK